MVALALLLHGALLGTVSVYGADLVGGGFIAHVPQHDTATAPETALRTTCTGDVLLATGARFGMCGMATDPEACADHAIELMWIDLSGCSERLHPSEKAEVAFLDRPTDKVIPIDPEQLLEELKQEEQNKPPPPVPPPPQPEAAKPVPPPPPPPPAPKRPQQVVETVKPSDEKEPDNARFLAEYNSKVEKEKVARGAASEPMIAKSKPQELQAKKDPNEASVQKPAEQDPGRTEKAPQVPGKLSMRPPGAPGSTQEPQEAQTRGERTGATDPIVSDGFIPHRGDAAVEQQRRDPGEKTKGQNGAGGGSPPVPDLKPSKEVLERALGGGNVDHLEQVENGDETALSAKRWVFASFFNRLKRQVAQNWDPQTVWRRSDPDGTHHGFKTRVTEVRVSLNNKGELQKIVVTAPCGVSELDDEAVRSFHAASPFPNPPDGLVQKDGLITFAFSFFFEIGAPHTSWRVIRNQ